MALFKTDSKGASGTDPAGASLTDAIAHVRRQCDEILERVNGMSAQLAQLTAREQELRRILEHNSQYEPHLERLGKLMRKKLTPDRINAAIDRADLRLDPCPYTVIDGLLPEELYAALLHGLPPVELFIDKPATKQQLAVPFDLAPTYSQRVWTHLVNELIPNVIAPRLIDKFRVQIDEWISLNWPQLDPRSVELHGSGGRVMLRRRGYRIRPHRDPKWSFITCILYLARPGDDEAWGTQIYAVNDDEEAKNAAPYWISEKQCRLVEDVRFKPNRLLVFLNSVGAHGASIPEDAQPENLERYIYQFRLGPTVEAIAMLKSMLPEERQGLWAGKALVDY
jgi:hypothetical protein